MLEIRDVEPLEGRTVRLTLSDGEVVVRDLSDLLHGPLFDRIAADDRAFRSGPWTTARSCGRATWTSRRRC